MLVSPKKTPKKPRVWYAKKELLKEEQDLYITFRKGKPLKPKWNVIKQEDRVEFEKILSAYRTSKQTPQTPQTPQTTSSTISPFSAGSVSFPGAGAGGGQTPDSLQFGAQSPDLGDTQRKINFSDKVLDSEDVASTSEPVLTKKKLDTEIKQAASIDNKINAGVATGGFPRGKKRPKLDSDPKSKKASENKHDETNVDSLGAGTVHAAGTQTDGKDYSDAINDVMQQLRDVLRQNNGGTPGQSNAPPPTFQKITAYGQDDQRKGAPHQIIDRVQILRDNRADNEKGADLGQSKDDSTPSLRPQYGIAGVQHVIPPVNEQIRSDIEFDMFSVVQPGFGEGVDNKLFLYQEARDKFIHFAKPFYSPNVWLGPSNYQHPLPWQWQNVKDASDIARHLMKTARQAIQTTNLIKAAGEGSANAFGRDVPEVVQKVSSSGLPRDPRTVFEPVINNKDPWTPIIDPAGKDLGRRGFKRLFSPWRDPDAFEQQKHNGGPTLNKRRSLEVILR